MSMITKPFSATAVQRLRSRVSVGPGSAGRLMSLEQFDAIRPEQFQRGCRYELINGVDEYLAAGVKEYWVIDRFRRIMIVYRQTQTGPTFDIVTESDTYQTDLLPEFVRSLSELLAEADQCKQPAKPGRQSKQSRKPTPPAGGTDG